MDPQLIILLVPLIGAIGYILSRPFENPPQTTTTVNKDAMQQRYEALLLEINGLLQFADEKLDPKEVNKLIAAKKRQAADLLREIKPTLEKDPHL